MAMLSALAEQRIVELSYQGPTQRVDVCVRCSHSKLASDGREWTALYCDVIKGKVSKFGKCDAWTADGAANQPTEDTHEPEPLRHPGRAARCGCQHDQEGLPQEGHESAP